MTEELHSALQLVRSTVRNIRHMYSKRPYPQDVSRGKKANLYHRPYTKTQPEWASASKIHTPLWKIYHEPFTQGVLISSGIAYCTLPLEISTPSVGDIIQILHRGCVTFK